MTIHNRQLERWRRADRRRRILAQLLPWLFPAIVGLSALTVYLLRR